MLLCKTAGEVWFALLKAAAEFWFALLLCKAAGGEGVIILPRTAGRR